MGCRVLKKNDKKVTFSFKGASHKGIDLVGPGSTLDYIVAHSDGTVVAVVSNINYNTSKSGKRIYGNYVKIKHDNGMYTLYAHMKYGSIIVKNGDRVSKGQVIGYMGNTGYSFGAHLHFEVRDENDKYIDPTKYVDADLPAKETARFTIGQVYTTQVNLNVRDGAGTNSRQKNRNELTADGQKHSVNAGVAVLKTGTRVTCLEVKNMGNDIWIRIPSGWIAGYYQGKEYVK
jgi:murein DD-endopeptidase MepM/ murein hydrolase activator NlpD